MRGDPKLPLTQEEQREIAAYQESLIGKRIDEWVGWTSSITPAKELAEADQHNFTMWMNMDNPSTEKGIPYTEVMLHGLSREQAEQFEAWSMNPDINKTNKVVFSGTIYGVHDLTVEAYVSQITPAE